MDPALLRLAAVVGLVVVATVVGRVVTARRDRIVAVTDGDLVDVASVAAVDAASPSSVSAMLFGSATCGPCETVKQRLRDVERDDPRLTWSYVDAAEHLDLAREHGVRRVPTLLVLDAHGHVVARTSGVPRRDELVDAVARAAGDARDGEATGADSPTGDVARTA